MNYLDLLLLEGQHWDLFLHADQTVIGRVYLWSKSDATDLMDVSIEAFQELHALGRRVKAALTQLYQPSIFNYLSLNHQTPHLHVHIIPRYERPIARHGYTFIDENFGSSYRQNKSLELPDSIYTAIRDGLRTALQ